MERRGSGVEYWRGEAHLGSSLPASACCRPCPLIVSHVHASWPVSAHHCPCPHVIACVHTLLPMSVSCCPCPCVVAHVHALLPTSVHICGQSFSFVGVGSSLHSWAVSSFGVVHLRSWAMAQCGGGEPLVGGGESSGLAWLLWWHCGARWCVSQLSCCCLVATLPAAMWHLWLLSMKRQGGALCCLPGLATPAIIVIVALWWALDGGGGWVASSMLVVVGRKKQQCGNI